MQIKSKAVRYILNSLLIAMILLLMGLTGACVFPQQFNSYLSVIESKLLLLANDPPIAPQLPAPNNQPSNNTFDLLAHTVRIRVENSSASGVILWAGQSPTSNLYHTIIITNAHALRGQNEAFVDIFNYIERKTIASITSYTATLLQKSDPLDLAIVEVRSPSSFGIPAELVTLEELNNISLNDNITVCGCGLGNPPYLTRGTLAIYGDDKHLLTTFSIFGNSGGGAYIETGKLFGLISGVAAVEIGHEELKTNIVLPEPNLTQCIPSFVIAAWLQRSRFKFIIGEGSSDEYLQSTSRRTRYNFY